MVESLKAAFSDAPAVALSAAFAWGLISMLLSPCHLAAIPMIVGFVDKQDGDMSGRRAFRLSLFFAIGLFIAIAVIGMITAVLGRAIGDVPYRGVIVAGVFFVVGLNMLGVIPLSWKRPQTEDIDRKGWLSAICFGTIFGVALGPCTFAFMAPLLAVSFQTASASLIYGILLLVFYGVGHCSVIVIAGTCSGVVQRYLQWSHASKGTVLIKVLCGVLLLVAGLYMLAIT